MTSEGRARRVRIYVSESARTGHEPTYAVVLRFLRREHAAGATVFRAVEGFGGTGVLHTFRLADVVQDLPMVIEWVDHPERVEQLLDQLKALVTPGGLITAEDTDIVLFNLHPLRRLSDELTAGDVMSKNVVSVEPSTPVRDVVELLIGKPYRAIPVVDGGQPSGIITNSDLVSRGELDVRVELLPALDTSELHAELDRLSKGAKAARDIMTPSPITAGVHAPLTQVAETMARRRFKRLPVVDEQGHLVGIISRFDVLRTVSEGYPEKEAPKKVYAGLNVSVPVASVMRRDVPTVLPTASVDEVTRAVMSTRLNRVLVVDEHGHVVGLVSDAELLEHVVPSLRRSALQALMRRLPFLHPGPEEASLEHHARARTAQELMSTEVATASDALPLRDVIGPMLSGRQKLLAIVDKDGKFVGALDRADVLVGLLERTEWAAVQQ